MPAFLGTTLFGPCAPVIFRCSVVVPVDLVVPTVSSGWWCPKNLWWVCRP